MMHDDPIVAAVRQVRDELSRRLNYEVHAIFAEMRLRETAHGSRLVHRLSQPAAPSREPRLAASEDVPTTMPSSIQ